VAKIRDLLGQGTSYSFEFFPPKTDKAQEALERAITELEALDPTFVSVTYGAGGSTRERTQEIVTGILRDTSLTPMAHLTCAAHTVDELRTILGGYAEAGVDNILALHGDPPADLNLPAGDLDYAVQLVELVHEVGDFSVGVAVHPEGHPLSTDRDDDRAHQAAKLQVADFGITQFGFFADDYFRFRDEMHDRGVTTPVIPGIMPPTNLTAIPRMSEMNGVVFPEDVAERLERAGDDKEALRVVGVEHATALCADLLEGGVPGLHFYTLNRSTATREIYENLGLPVGT